MLIETQAPWSIWSILNEWMRNPAHYHVPNSLWVPNELNHFLARARLIQCDCPSPTDSKNQISIIPISQSQYFNACAEFPQIPISQYPSPNIPMLVLNFPRSQYPNIPIYPNPNIPMLVLNFPRSQYPNIPPQYSNACAEFPQIPISQYPNPNIPMLVLNFPRSQYPNIPMSQSQYSNACAEFPQIPIYQYPNPNIPMLVLNFPRS